MDRSTQNCQIRKINLSPDEVIMLVLCSARFSHYFLPFIYLHNFTIKDNYSWRSTSSLVIQPLEKVWIAEQEELEPVRLHKWEAIAE